MVVVGGGSSATGVVVGITGGRDEVSTVDVGSGLAGRSLFRPMFSQAPTHSTSTRDGWLKCSFRDILYSLVKDPSGPLIFESNFSTSCSAQSVRLDACHVADESNESTTIG